MSALSPPQWIKAMRKREQPDLRERMNKLADDMDYYATSFDSCEYTAQEWRDAADELRGLAGI